MFILRHTPSFFVLLCLASFFGFFSTRLDLSLVLSQTIFQYLPEFYPFPGTRSDPSLVLAWILPFFDTRSDPSSVLAWILPLFWYSPGPFPGTCLDPFPVLTQTLLRYQPRFYPFPGTRLYSFLVLTRTLLRYSLGFYLFPGTRPYPSLVLARNLPLSRYSPVPFSGTRPESTIFRYSPEFYHFLVLTRIRSFLQYSPDMILSVLDSPILARIRSPVCLVFFGTRPDTISSPVSCPDFLTFSSITFGFLYSSLVSCPDSFSFLRQCAPSPFDQHDSFPLAFFIIVWGQNCWSFEFFTRVHFTQFIACTSNSRFTCSSTLLKRGIFGDPQFCPSTLAFILGVSHAPNFFHMVSPWPLFGLDRFSSLVQVHLRSNVVWVCSSFWSSVIANFPSCSHHAKGRK